MNQNFKFENVRSVKLLKDALEVAQVFPQGIKTKNGKPDFSQATTTFPDKYKKMSFAEINDLMNLAKEVFNNGKAIPDRNQCGKIVDGYRKSIQQKLKTEQNAIPSELKSEKRKIGRKKGLRRFAKVMKIVSVLGLAVLFPLLGTATLVGAVGTLVGGASATLIALSGIALAGVGGFTGSRLWRKLFAGREERLTNQIDRMTEKYQEKYSEYDKQKQKVRELEKENSNSAELLNEYADVLSNENEAENEAENVGGQGPAKDGAEDSVENDAGGGSGGASGGGKTPKNKNPEDENPGGDGGSGGGSGGASGSGKTPEDKKPEDENPGGDGGSGGGSGGSGGAPGGGKTGIEADKENAIKRIEAMIESYLGDMHGNLGETKKLKALKTEVRSRIAAEAISSVEAIATAEGIISGVTKDLVSKYIENAKNKITSKTASIQDQMKDFGFTQKEIEDKTKEVVGKYGDKKSPTLKEITDQYKNVTNVLTFAQRGSVVFNTSKKYRSSILKKDAFEKLFKDRILTLKDVEGNELKLNKIKNIFQFEVHTKNDPELTNTDEAFFRVEDEKGNIVLVDKATLENMQEESENNV